LQRQQNVFTVATKYKTAVQVSFIISQIVAKNSRPFTGSEYVKECIMKAAEVPEVPRPEKQMFFPAYMGAEHMNDLVRAIQCQLTEK
jgi:hypothetical protein